MILKHKINIYYLNLIELVNKYMKLGMNQYAAMPGLLSLREKIAQKTYDLYSAQYDANSEITIVPGATHGIYAIMSAMIREGDEVIVIEPCYDSYVPAIELNGGRAIHVELKLPEFKIDWNEVKKLVNFKTKMIFTLKLITEFPSDHKLICAQLNL